MHLNRPFKMAVIVTLTASGCVTDGRHRGTVAMKLDNNEAHVGLGNTEVKAGDRVELYRNVCSGGAGGEGDSHSDRLRTCRKEPAGDGVVLNVIDKDYSIVKFADGVKFSEGDVIEKLSH